MKKFLSFSFALALIACGSSAKDPAPTGPSNQTTDPGTPGDNTTPVSSDPVSDGGTTPPSASTDSGPKAPTNQAECVAVCEAQHPKASALNKQLDATCFLGGSCEPDCNNHVPGGKQFPVSAGDAGDSCPIADGIDPIMTLSQACSDCVATTPSCCKLWVDIFGSDDGRSLNKCAVACFAKFAK